MTFEQLREVRSAYKERAQLADRIAELESMRISPRAAAYGSERVQAAPKGDIQPDSIARMDELLDKYNAALQRCIMLANNFEDALKNLNGRERQVMRLYYIEGYTWEHVAVKMNMTWRRVHQIKRNAIDIIVDEK